MKTKLAEFTTEQAAAILQKTPEQIQTLCRIGLLDAVKACGTWRIYDLQIQGEAQPTKPRRTQRRATPPRTLARLEVEPVTATIAAPTVTVEQLPEMAKTLTDVDAANWKNATMLCAASLLIAMVLIAIIIITILMQEVAK